MDAILDCLASLARLDPPAAAVVVVTNNPSEFDGAAARTALPEFALVKSDTNMGYAGGCNLGAARALSRGVDLVVFLNDDVVVPPDLCARFGAAAAEHPVGGVFGAVVVYRDRPGIAWFAGGRLYRWIGYTRHTGYGRPAGGTPDRRVDFINGCAMAVRRTVLEATGGFDQSYFHYFEDVDLCERARELGWASYVISGAPVLHAVSASSGGAGPGGLNAWQAYHMARNRSLFARRRLRGAQRVTALAAQVFVLLPYELQKFCRRGNLAAARAHVSGVIAGILGRDGPRGAAPTPIGGGDRRTA
jgi:GT2 family glycosyltransferase